MAFTIVNGAAIQPIFTRNIFKNTIFPKKILLPLSTFNDQSLFQLLELFSRLSLQRRKIYRFAILSQNRLIFTKIRFFLENFLKFQTRFKMLLAQQNKLFRMVQFSQSQRRAIKSYQKKYSKKVLPEKNFQNLFLESD